MKLFEISGYFEVKNKGTVIGGVNPELDHLSHGKIKELIGESIVVIDSEDNKHVFDVVSFQISTSLVNKRNIGICIGFPENIDFLKSGAIVYSNEALTRE
ncbi:hypothetical protein [Paenibacillus fonticola]|uniref:hypothetical protein n=1 Tax=Paenibacillus fonticola TaxID=379896 RepID=UPI000379768C|nr:hypothetical protein [Paenibacillus fonticola]